MIEFSSEPARAANASHPGLLYDEAAKSFWAPISSSEEFESVLVNDLDVHLDAEGRVLSIDGYAPRESWNSTTATPPSAEEGIVLVRPSGRIRGASRRLETQTRWPFYFNELAGWLCVGQPIAEARSKAVRVAPDTVLVLTGSELRAIWLHVRPLDSISASI